MKIGSRIVVLGGNGFVGKNLCAKLDEQGFNYTTASRATGVDLTELDQIEGFLQKTNPDIIFNCAAHVGSVHYVTAHAAEVIEDNTRMSLNLYKAVAKYCKTAKIINPLSNCSYPGESDIQIENEWFSGPVHESVFAYGNAKKILYTISKCYAKQYNIASINLLIPNTFGPGDSADPNKTHALNGMIIRMLEAKKNNVPQFEIWGTGKPVREWAYVEDIIQLMIESVDKIPDCEPVNLAQNTGQSIAETAKSIAEAIQYSGELVFNTKYPDGAPTKILENSKFKIIFPNFIFYNHQEGIKNTVKYYQEALQ